jgi:hypothetical protein
MTSIFKRRNTYDKPKKETPTNINNSNMYRPKNLSFQAGGNKKQKNGYDAIDPSMYQDMQQMYDYGYQPSQEEMSSYLAGLDFQEAQMRANQNKKLGQKMFSKPVYDYLINQKVPQVQQYIDPNYMLKNQSYQDGGSMQQQEQPMQEQGQEQQIMQMVMQALQQGTPPEQVMQMLVQQGIPQEQAQMIIQEIMAQMQGQMSQQQPTNDMSQGMPMQQMGGYRPKGLSFDY